MRFDLTDLRLFLHIVEAESITQGAERAGLALPSASARIRGMEETSRIALLDRNSRGVRPTPAGEALLHHARIVIGQIEQMRGDLHLYAEGLRGHIRLLSVTAAQTHLPERLQRFLVSHPAIDIDLKEMPSQEIVATVAGGLADLGIAADTADTGSLETLPFETDGFVLIVPPDHRFAGTDEIAFRDALGEPFVSLPTDSALQTYLASHAAREGRPFKLRVSLGSFEAICRMVGGGVGSAIVPSSVARKYRECAPFRIVGLAETWATRRLSICARSFAALPVHARQLVDMLGPQ
jgi:DNA-binding transcriptional LysR family regulator